MAQEGYLLVNGFGGQNTRRGAPKNSSLLYSLVFDVSHPMDASHHVFTGKRFWSTVRAEIPVDASIYQYYQAVVDADNKANPLAVEVGLYRQNQPTVGVLGFGDDKPYLKVNLVDARVSGVSYSMEARGGIGTEAGDQFQKGPPTRVRGMGDLEWKEKQREREALTQTLMKCRALPDRILVAFAFRQIEITFVSGNKMVTDSWDAT
jgi:hypothetical protein